MKKLPFLISLSLVGCLVILYLIIPSFQAFIKEAFEVLTSDDEEANQGMGS
jgi:hypothetical protein